MQIFAGLALAHKAQALMGACVYLLLLLYTHMQLVLLQYNCLMYNTLEAYNCAIICKVMPYLSANDCVTMQSGVHTSAAAAVCKGRLHVSQQCHPAAGCGHEVLGICHSAVPCLL